VVFICTVLVYIYRVQVVSPPVSLTFYMFFLSFTPIRYDLGLSILTVLIQYALLTPWTFPPPPRGVARSVLLPLSHIVLYSRASTVFTSDYWDYLVSKKSKRDLDYVTGS
jgi:hypothetical protein